MNLEKLSRHELDSRIKNLVGKEREVLYAILLTIKEIDQRRTFLEMGYANLFSYLVEGVGYSAGSAHRRIEGARLLKDIPSLGAKIQSGEVGLNQIALVQKTAREVYKRTAVKVSAADKNELIGQISNMSYQDSQKEVASFFDIPVVQETTQKVQADDSLRVELTLSSALREKLERAQALISHAVPEKDLLSFLEYAADLIVKQKTSVRKLKSDVESSEKNSTVEVTSFSARDKKIILKNQACCQYVDPETGKTCGSRWFAQVDHKTSMWAGGGGEIKNAQVLCGAHNRLKYMTESGRKFVS